MRYSSTLRYRLRKTQCGTVLGTALCSMVSLQSGCTDQGSGTYCSAVVRLLPNGEDVAIVRSWCSPTLDTTIFGPFSFVSSTELAIRSLESGSKKVLKGRNGPIFDRFVISPNGRYLLTMGRDTDAGWFWRYDLTNGTEGEIDISPFQWYSVNPANGPPAISEDGQLAFQNYEGGTSTEGDLIEGIRVFDPQSETSEIVSMDSEGEKLAFCYRPSVSADGTRIAFISKVVLDVGSDGFYVRDRQSGTTSMVCEAVYDPHKECRGYPVISGDGKFVAYVTLEENSTNGALEWACHLFELSTGHTTQLGDTWVEVSVSYEPEISISFDGASVVFSRRRDSIFLYNRTSDSITPIGLMPSSDGTTSIGGEGDLCGSNPTISGDGSRVVFYCGDWYLYDTKTSSYTKISTN